MAFSFAGPACRILAVALSMAYLGYLSWARWADPLVDFGQQLYLAWQVADGKRLHLDLAYYNGPLSVWLNAAAFDRFGTGVWTIIACNAAILVVTLALLYWLFRETSGSWAATLAALVFIWLFAFGKYIENSNYNYLCPYNHELTHGLCFALAMIALLWRGAAHRFVPAALAGALGGLVFLTKSEMSLAAAGAALAYWVMAWTSEPPDKRLAVITRFSIFLAVAALPVLIAFGYLASYLPLPQAWIGTIGSWAVALHPEIRDLYFYRKGLGTADLERNLTLLARGSGVYGLFLLTNVVAAVVLRRYSSRWRIAVTVLIGVAFVAALAAYSPITEVFLPLPAVLSVLLIWLVIGRRRNLDPADRMLAERRIVLVVFAGLLLLKMALATRIVHYGFVLAMPAVLVVAMAFTSWIPARWSARGLYGGCLAGSSAIVIVFIIVLGQAVHHTYYLLPARPIGSGTDYMLSESPKAEAVARMSALLAEATSRNDRVLVFPEGVMLNYLSRRETGVAYTNFMPPEVLFFGEANMLMALRKSPPDWIVMAPKDMVDYRVRVGDGFLDDMVHWIGEAYIEHRRIDGDKGNSMVLLKRRPS